MRCPVLLRSTVFLVSLLPHSLSARLKLLTIVWVVLAAASIIFTLILSWQLEGGAAAINDAGSLRMQAYRINLMLAQQQPTTQISAKISTFDTTLQQLRQGDASRPLFLPNDPLVRQQMAALMQQWQQHIRPRFEQAVYQQQPIEAAQLEDFVANIDRLVLSVENVNARYTDWLRLFQNGLMTMVLLGAGIMVVLLYLWIIRPLNDLQNGVRAIYDGTLGTQIPVNHLREFAHLDQGFNQMSLRLQQLYTHLEQEVADKTRDLATKNHTLETLYSFSRLLNQTQTAADAGTVFLKKIMRLLPARAGSIRLLDWARQRMDLVAHRNLPPVLQNAEACQTLEDCFCGQSVARPGWQPIHFQPQHAPAGQPLQPLLTQCERSGFHYLQVFKIRYKGEDLGLMTLYFDSEQDDPQTASLINSLCNLMGLVLTNIRLADESRQLAVLQERNLMAQGLHDSIAQTLTFLNLQVQMLETALHENNAARADENLQFIKAGVQECYEDVRELLLNFRTKITRKEFTEAVDTLSRRFEQQTGVPVRVSWRGNGPQLGSEQQLQFIFILQESLSNIRKHAEASEVEIVFDNRQDFVMQITDNGRGFDTAALSTLSGSHVGLNIMRERALRIHAELELVSEPQQYTRITLTLPQQERILV